MRERLALHVTPHELPEVQQMARLLLRQPLVTANQPTEFALIRRWETVLRNEFSQKFGYRLDVSRTAARLLRRPSTLSKHRGARVISGRGTKPLNRWGYVYLSLALAALENQRDQVLASELLIGLEQLVRGDTGLSLDRTEAVQRNAWIDALRYLIAVGILTEVDGTVADLRNDSEVLFNVNRDATAMCLVATPSVLKNVSTAADFLAEPEPTTSDGQSRRARHLLNRRIVDSPLVVVSDLSEPEFDLAWRNRRREADNITRLTGCPVELRSEGIALIDAAATPISRSRFPGAGTEAHAALLWLSALLKSTALKARQGESVHVERADAEQAWLSVMEDYGSRFHKDGRNNPARLRTECLTLLVEHGLVRPGPDDDELCLMAVAARFDTEARFVETEAR